MSGQGITVNLEKSELSSNLNSTIFGVFFMGMYTMVYFGAIYIYLTKNSSNRFLVSATITVLFFTNVTLIGIQWYLTKWQFINNGDTRDSVFTSIYSTPIWIELAVIILQSIGYVLADGLLIWRCYFVWDRSFRIISVPLLFVFTETGLFFAQIVIHAIFTHLIISPAQAKTFNDLLAAGYFMTFATSLVTTTLIAYRIYSVLKQEGTSARRFKHVLDIVVQSGAVYSLVMLAIAIGSVLPGAGNPLNTRMYSFLDYISALAIPASGVSATILVARVALLAPDTTFLSTSGHLSGLQFHAHSAHHTEAQEGMVSTSSINMERNMIGEGQEIKDKVQ